MLEIQRSEKGAVSLFIVIFTALLITVISVSFIRLMVQDQTQATTADLSASAYDSAQAGVEDAKRLLVSYQTDCVATQSPQAKCAAIEQLLRVSLPCDTIQQSGIAGNKADNEVVIKQTESDQMLQQAYTCVKVMIDTDDYIGSVDSGQSRLIPLKGTGDFNQVVLQWFSQTDLQDASSGPGQKTIDLPSDPTLLTLPKLKDWSKNRPSLMRAQLIQFGPSFKLSNFDKTPDGFSNAHTLFLDPYAVGSDAVDFAQDTRLSQSSGVLQPVLCDRNFSTSTVDENYACSVTLSLPSPVGATDGSRTAFLRLDPIYNSLTHFSVKLQNGSNIVKFRNVQPIVDSTGRANDLFRRVQSRVELQSNDTFSYPDSAINLTGSLCKTFLVTDKAADYTQGLCDPKA